jgi:predicted regulator of Ras-like GTPase activity (Roadblock/LC7/MglB family)
VNGPVQTKYRAILERLRNSVDETQAVILAGPEGIVDYVTADPAINIESIASEYAMLLRIAGHTSEDTGAGNLLEHIVVSERSLTIARAISSQHFLILLCRAQDQIGRARYQVKQAAREIHL